MAYNKESLLNQEIIQTLVELGDGDDGPFIYEIIGMYLSDAPVIIKKIVEYADSNELQKLTHVSHTLKGSSANIGASEVSAICALIEKKSKSGNLEGVNELIDDLKSCFSDTVTELEKIINS